MDNQPTHRDLFGRTIEFPDYESKTRLDRLVGLDEKKTKLRKMLSLTVNPTGLLDWAKTHHSNAIEIIEYVQRRSPLIILAGDVGSGKTELAETIGDDVARQEKISITLFPLSLSTRGQGRVGEMTQLLTKAFDYTIDEAKQYKSNSNPPNGAVILLIDEADALAQSREETQMHHEDKAGVNAFIRGIDLVGKNKLPVAIIMCTNRIGAIDPAIRRRAADVLTFSRPSEVQRLEVLSLPLKQLGFSDKQIDSVVELTGPRDNCDYGCTYSDLTNRLLPTIVLDAYPNQKISVEKVIETAKSIIPTPPFQDISS